MAFPNFFGRNGENAGDFLDNLEMAFLVSGRDDEALKLRAFPLVLKEEARVWFQALDPTQRAEWEGLKAAFLRRFQRANSAEELWQRLLALHQIDPHGYATYEEGFLKLWGQWSDSLNPGERAPNCLQKDRFISGLYPLLREKVKSKFPNTFEDALRIAREKNRKILYQAQAGQLALGGNVTTMNASQAPPNVPNAPGLDRGQEDMLQQINNLTNQLEGLRVNLVQGARRPIEGNGGNRPPMRRQAREMLCYNCGENGHGMYNCPHPRRYDYPVRGPRQQVSPPRARAQVQEQPQPQILQPPRAQGPGPAAQPNVSIIRMEEVVKDRSNREEIAKGKMKIDEVATMPIKRVRVQNEASKETSKDASNEASTSRATKDETKKRKARTRSQIDISDFPMGSRTQPYDLTADVSSQGPKITWPQLLHISPKLRRQWSKMVSTRAKRSKLVSVIKAYGLKDIVPLVEAQIKGQRIPKTYIDSGAEVCVMTEKLMHQLGLEVMESSNFRAKMANNVSVTCVGVVKALRVSVFGITAEVDAYVMPVGWLKGEGYPLILGRPWLMGIGARQDWATGDLELRPRMGGHSRKVVYNLKNGRQENLELETSADEWSSSGCSSSVGEEESSSEESDSTLKVMGVTIKETTSSEDNPRIQMEKLWDASLEKMLSKDIKEEEREGYVNVLKKHASLFISDYTHITGVTAVKHHIHLKEGSKPVVQRLRRLGVVQQNALLSEVKRLLEAGFIYPVEDSEWVSPVVVRPKKNG